MKNILINWWNVAPYIYVKNNKLTGIIPDTFGTNLSLHLCGHQCKVSYTEDLKTYTHLFNKTLNHQPHSYPLIALYAPIYANPGHGHLKDFHGMALANSTHQTLLIRSFYSSLLYRGMIVGTQSSFIFFFVIFVFLSMFSFLAWLVEHREKDSPFHRYFSRGVWNGFYWATVTMTSVGYGDITTKSALGKIIAVTWMLCSVLLLSALTAMLTSGLGNVISLENHRVGHLNRISIHKKIHRERGIPVGYGSYDDLFKSTENGTTFSSLADTLTISYIQDDLWDKGLIIDRNIEFPLSVEVKVPIKDHGNDTQFFDCLAAALRSNSAKYVRRLKPNKGFTVMAALQVLSKKDTPIFIIIISILIFLIICGIGIDLWSKFKESKATDKAQEADTENEECEPPFNPNVSFQGKTAHHIQLAQICNNISKLRTELGKQADLLRALKQNACKET